MVSTTFPVGDKRTKGGKGAQRKQEERGTQVEYSEVISK